MLLTPLALHQCLSLGPFEPRVVRALSLSIIAFISTYLMHTCLHLNRFYGPYPALACSTGANAYFLQRHFIFPTIQFNGARCVYVYGFSGPSPLLLHAPFWVHLPYLDLFHSLQCHSSSPPPTWGAQQGGGEQNYLHSATARPLTFFGHHFAFAANRIFLVTISPLPPTDHSGFTWLSPVFPSDR